MSTTMECSHSGPEIGNADADAVDPRWHAAQERETIAEIGGIERGEAGAHIRHAARQDAGRIGGTRRHDAQAGPAILKSATRPPSGVPGMTAVV